jgi:hypothetical protein
MSCLPRQFSYRPKCPTIPFRHSGTLGFLVPEERQRQGGRQIKGGCLTGASGTLASQGSRQEGDRQVCRFRGYPPDDHPKSEQIWKLARCGRPKGNGYEGQLGRDLSRNVPSRGLFPHSKSAGSMDRRSLDTRFSQGSSDMHHIRHGPRAVVRCSREPSWGQTK